MRLLVEDERGALTIDHRLLNLGLSDPENPNEHIERILECPFKFIGCLLEFTKAKDWVWHASGHFDIDSPYTDGPAMILPPRENCCCSVERHSAIRAVCEVGYSA